MNTCSEIFSMVKDFCREEMPASPYGLWIEDIKCTELTNDSAYLQVATELRRTIIESRYLPLVKKAFKEVMGFEVNVILESLEENEAGVAPLILTNEEREEENKILSQNGEYSYTFDNFIVGSSNKFAHAASLAVAEAPAAAYNPLFIHGGSGLGKTHLLCAICNEIEKNNPSSNILYVKSEGFTNELIDSLSKNKMAEFRDKYRPVDVLLMDDIQFIGGKDSTQEEFFHTFNTLYEAGKQIVVTSDRPPKEIKTLEDRLRTRFESGLIADIQPPDYETRVAIIKRKAELLDLELSPDVIDYIATKLKTNIRQLEGTVKKIKANKLLAGMTPTIVSAQNAIRDILNDSQPISVVIERIIAEVARYYEVSPSDVKSNKRAAQISLARQASMYIIREITGISMAAIGDEFGGRDHSTVVYALKQVDSMLSTNPHFKNTVEDIIKNIKNEN
ncbi:MAG: chromosomal replication initiator protein DnaA [Oscillospiraceae bacterium]